MLPNVLMRKGCVCSKWRKECCHQFGRSVEGIGGVVGDVGSRVRAVDRDS